MQKYYYNIETRVDPETLELKTKVQVPEGHLSIIDRAFFFGEVRLKSCVEKVDDVEQVGLFFYPDHIDIPDESPF